MTAPSAHTQEMHPPLRVLALQVTGVDGGTLALQVPWDRSAFDLEPYLVAGTAWDDPDRTILAHPAGDEAHDLLEVPLAQALAHDGNPRGAGALELRVEGPHGGTSFRISVAGVAEPEPHRPYPRALDEAAERLLAAAAEDPDWFCDGSSTLSCCVAQREAPHEQDWVAV